MHEWGARRVYLIGPSPATQKICSTGTSKAIFPQKLLYIVIRLTFRTYFAHCNRKNLRTAVNVSSISSSVIAAETNIASNCEGAR